MNTSKTLLAILVEELPKRGGWPQEAAAAVYDHDKVCFTEFAAPTFMDKSTGWTVLKDMESAWLIGEAFDYSEMPYDWQTSIITRDQYEAALAEGLPEKLEAQRNLTKSPAADADGWIEWHGGECPVGIGTLVDVKHRDGDTGFAKEAGKYGTGAGNAAAVEWDHTHEGGDIIAYRIHQPQDITSRANDDRLAQDLNLCIGQPGEDYSPLVLQLIATMQDAQVNLSLNDAFELAETLVDAGYRKQ